MARCPRMYVDVVRERHILHAVVRSPALLSSGPPPQGQRVVVAAFRFIQEDEAHLGIVCGPRGAIGIHSLCAGFDLGTNAQAASFDQAFQIGFQGGNCGDGPGASGAVRACS